MAIIVLTENMSGFGVAFVPDTAARDRTITGETVAARATCSRLAQELAGTNPTRAAALAAAAADPTRTAHELWGLAKNEERPPRPVEPEPADEKPLEGLQR